MNIKVPQTDVCYYCLFLRFICPTETFLYICRVTSFYEKQKVKLTVLAREFQTGYNQQQTGSSMSQLFLKLLKLHKYRDPHSTSAGRGNVPKPSLKVLNCVNIVSHAPHQAVAEEHRIVDFQPPIKTNDEVA